MKLSPDEVAKVARLARLDVAPEKLELFAEQFNDILGYMDKLGELDTANVDPMYSPVEHCTVLRKDEARKDYTRDEVLSNAPEGDDRFFIVPKIV